jgi:N-methylhydantoinase B
VTARSAKAGDPLRLLVFHHLFAACAEEMGESLMRAAFSPNIRERRDFSCALFDARGEAVAQAAHLPVHLGSAPLSLAAVLEDLELAPGDVALVNDPYRGGTHLPDLTVAEPVWLTSGGAPDFWCLARAHHADMGGAHPGSMAPARDIHGEGLRLPPVRLVRGGQVDEDLLRVFLANTRVPRERRADLQAQLAACRAGSLRLRALAEEHGARELILRAGQLIAWTEARTRAVLAELPAGTIEVEDTLELASGGVARLRLAWSHGPSGAVFDFRATDDQLPDPVNTVHAVALSAVHYGLRLLLPEGTPTNAGIGRCATVRTRPGSLLDAGYPAPVAAGNVETSQRAVDLVLAALRAVLPDRIPAASSGTMSNLTLGAGDGSFSYYETLAGGAGGGPEGPGAHAVHTHMTNTRNTPVEVLERELPVRVLQTSVRRGSGGAGEHPGGDGLVRRLQVLAPVRAGWSAQRQVEGPPGAAGGAAGACGGASLRRAGTRRDAPLPGQAALDLAPGDELEVRTPGGGGHGRSPRAKPGARG